VEGPDGRWWATFLASRPYEEVHYNTGRETFLLPVTWKDGWPVILLKGQAIPYVVAGLPGTSETTGNFAWRDDFDERVLRPEWLQLRVPKQQWVDLESRPGWLTIHPLPVGLDTLSNPSFLARRQQHMSFDAATELEIPRQPGVAAGLAAFQGEGYWYFLGVRRNEVFLEKQGKTIAHAALPAGQRIKLRISGNARLYSFYFDAAGWKPLQENDDGSILSTDVAGGFVGATVGPYARLEN
jgi:alpha-N-arabinofuranosidase